MSGLKDETAAQRRLQQLALNLWWTWQPDVIGLFRELDPAAWRETNHNPIALLKRLGQDEVADRIDRRSLESRINFQYRRLEEYLTSERTWCTARAGVIQVTPVAYFSAEFGLHESLPLYSGGLGILAGDYLKSASDLGLLVAGVGLFYAQGYFHQRLDPAGSQQEEYGVTDIDALPLVRAAAPDGSALAIQVQCGEEMLNAGVWLAHVGRARLVLLDSDIEPNAPHLRALTGRLYGGDELTRIRQEILLGIGGLRALRALDIRPQVLHLNEGHSAFAILERVRERVEEDNLSVDDAWRETAIQTIFTTHTPVDAGHDRFGPELVQAQLGWMRSRLQVDSTRFLAAGRVNPGDSREPLTMTVLGLKGSRHCNGVSSLHGHVARKMWNRVWPDRGEEDVPIGHVTNGVHVASWLAPSMRRLYDRHLGPEWTVRHSNPETWLGLASLDDGELWETHVMLRHRLVEFVRRRVASPSALDPHALTIGFARRFATYKRATLVLSDLDRLAGLMSNPDRPVQLVLSGKAHPRDEGGKAMIRQIVELSRDRRFDGRLVFLEDYDINVARHLGQSGDVWLNTPERPLEACGTSGQKVVLNGGLNLSVLDGWWAEAYDGENGFAIGSGTVHSDASVQWARDAEVLYCTLEREVLPLFFDVDRDGLPRRWVGRMKRSIGSLAWRFSADRMVIDYVNGCYLPAAGGVSMSMPR